MKRIILIILAVGIICAIALGIYSYSTRQSDSEEQITFALNDTLPDGEGREATVIILGGQSNASGTSRDEYLERNVSADKYEEYQRGYDNVYINYAVSGYHFSEGFVTCGAKQGEGGGFFGPELGMAERLNELYPDRTFFIVKYAWGGTNLYKQWLSPSSGKTGDLYKEFEVFVESSLKYLVAKNYDVSIEGMCWMQGESDSITAWHGVRYEGRLKNFISDVRERFAPYADDDGIAFVDAYIAATPVLWIHYDLVNESKRKVAESSPMNALVDTIAHGLTCSEEPEYAPDLAHYDSMSELKLGKLFIDELSQFMEE